MDKVLPDSSSTHRYENAKLVSWEDFLQGMGTGDILMHHGTGTNSRMMQKGMQCYYSHTCMVTRNPPEDVMALYEVKERCETGCYIWELTSQEAEHCRLIPFLPWLKHERTRNNEEYMLMWRKMNGLGSREEQLWDAIRKDRSIPYEKHMSQMFKALGEFNKHEHIESAFCSEVVAYAYKQSGVLSPQENASNYTTREFSAFYAKNDINEKMINGVRLDPERRVDLPSLKKSA
jgi:hypothetical protein